MEQIRENDVGRMTDFLLNRMDNIHFASIVLFDAIKSLEACEYLEEKIELIKERDKLVKSIVNLSSLEM